jgi:hypothetical protein
VRIFLALLGLAAASASTPEAELLLRTAETNAASVTNVVCSTNTKRAVRLFGDLRTIEEVWGERRRRTDGLAEEIGRLKVKGNRSLGNNYELSRMLEETRRLVLGMSEISKEHRALSAEMRSACTAALAEAGGEGCGRERVLLSLLLSRESPLLPAGPIVETLLDELRGLSRKMGSLVRRLERNARLHDEGSAAVRARIDRENGFLERDMDILLDQAERIERDSLQLLDLSPGDRAEAAELLRSVRSDHAEGRRHLR